jgi:hypothetical protein
VLISDGATSNRRVEFTPGAAGAVGGLPLTLLAEANIPAANPSAKDYLGAFCGSGTSDPSGQANSLSLYWDTTGALVLDQAGAVGGTDFRRWTYAGARAALAATYGSTRPVKFAVVFASPNTTTAPAIFVEGVDVTASGSVTTDGSVPNWVPPALVTTKWLSGYQRSAGRSVPHAPILGALTAAQILEWSQTGRLPTWCELGTGSAVNKNGDAALNDIAKWGSTNTITRSVTGGVMTLTNAAQYASITALISGGHQPFTPGARIRYRIVVDSVSGTGSPLWVLQQGINVQPNGALFINTPGTHTGTFIARQNDSTTVAYNFKYYGTGTGAMTISSVELYEEAPLVSPVIQPGCPVLTDSGSNGIPGLLTPGITAGGDKPEVIAIPIPEMSADGFIIANQGLVPAGYEPFAAALVRASGASTGTITIRKTSSGGTTLFTGTLAASVSLTPTLVPFTGADALHLSNSSWSSSSLKGRVLCRRVLNY